MRPLVVFAAAVALAVSAPAQAWIFFQQQYGDWLVLCWRSYEGADDPRCSLSAPLETLAEVTRDVLHVQEYAPDVYQVAIELRERPLADAPAAIRVGSFAAHEAPVVAELARWTGKAAYGIVGEMRGADGLVLRIRAAPNGRLYENEISLAGFREALDAYRVEIRRHGLLAKGP